MTSNGILVRLKAATCMFWVATSQDVDTSTHFLNFGSATGFSLFIYQQVFPLDLFIYVYCCCIFL